jgi:hypothetical protein
MTNSNQSYLQNIIPEPDSDEGAKYAIKDMQQPAEAQTPLPLRAGEGGKMLTSQEQALTMRNSVYAKNSGVNVGQTAIGQNSSSPITFQPREEG